MKKETKSEWLSESLQTVISGSGFVLIGSVISSIILLLNSILIARFWSPTELGVYTLAFSIIGFFSAIGLFGLNQSLTRFVAFEKGKKNDEKIPQIIITSIILTTIFSIIMSIILLFFADIISTKIFNEKKLIIPLTILIFIIPFSNIITLLSSFFRGLNNIKPMVYFQQIMHSFFVISSIIIIIFLDVSFFYIFYAFLFSTCLTFFVFLIYSLKKFETIKKFKIFNFDYAIAKKILFFSLPLLTVSILQKTNIWANNFLIGFLKNVESVGFYNVGVSLSGFITFPLGVILVMYMPVASNLYGKKNIKVINRVYVVLTKWLCFITFPIFLFIFLFPNVIIEAFYGLNYLIADDALRFLALSGILINFSGPNGATLISIGKPRLVLYSIIFSASINIILNILLIPEYGILGAAFSVFVSVFILNLTKNGFLYREIKLNPFNFNLLKPTFLTLIFCLFVYYLINNFYFVNNFIIWGLFSLFYLSYLMFYFLTRSIEDEDVQLIDFLCNKIGFKDSMLVRIFRKYKKE